jgi:hypothetical protein
MLIFANPLLKKYRCAIDWDKNELKISHNGKDLIIPVVMHKVKNKLEVNCASIASPAEWKQDADDTLKIHRCGELYIYRKSCEEARETA